MDILLPWAFTLELHLGPSSLLSKLCTVVFHSEYNEIWYQPHFFLFFFLPLVGDFSLLPRCLKHSSSFKFRCLTRKYLYIKYSKSEFLGIQCFPSDCRFSSFFTSGTCSYLTALGSSSLSFAGFSLCGISCVLKCWLIFVFHIVVPNYLFSPGSF